MSINRSLQLFLVGTITLWALAGALAWFVPLHHPISVPGLVADDNGQIYGVGRRASAAGVVPGDRIDFQKTPWEFRRYIALDPAIREPGTPMTIAVEHAGKIHMVNLRSHARPFTAAELGANAIRMFSQVLFILVGTGLVLLRPSIMTWAFYLYSVGPNVSWGRLQQLLPLQADIAVAAVAATSAAVGWACFLFFALRFPRDQAHGISKTVEKFAPLIFGLLVADAFWSALGNFLGYHTGWADSLGQIIFGAIYIAGLAAFVMTYRRTTSADRKRIEWVMLGFAIGAGALLLNAILSQFVVESNAQLISDAAITLNIATPLCVTYAILRHRVIDVRFVLNRTTVYAVLLLALGLLLAGVDWLFTRVLANTGPQITFVLAVALLIGFWLSSVRQKTIYWIDALLFRRRHEIHNATAAIREKIYEAKSAAELRQLLVVDVPQNLRLTSAAFFARCADGGYQRELSFGWPPGEAWHLLPEHPAIQGCGSDGIRMRDFPWRSGAGPVVAVPMIRGRTRLAVVLYGDHSPGTAIDPDELRDLRDIVSEAAFAYELLEKNEAAASAAPTRLA